MALTTGDVVEGESESGDFLSQVDIGDVDDDGDVAAVDVEP